MWVNNVQQPKSKRLACRFAGLVCRWVPVADTVIREMYNVQCQHCGTYSDKWGAQ